MTQFLTQLYFSTGEASCVSHFSFHLECFVSGSQLFYVLNGKENTYVKRQWVCLLDSLKISCIMDLIFRHGE